MGTVVLGKLFITRKACQISTIEYLKKIGIANDKQWKRDYDSFIEGEYYLIEFCEKFNWFEGERFKKSYADNDPVSIANISDSGIVFYLPCPEGDGHIFVPMNNIRSIASVDEDGEFYGLPL